MTRTILANAKLILPDDTTIGALVIEDGAIAEILPGTSVPPGALNMQGDYLAPGMVELANALQAMAQPAGIQIDVVVVKVSTDVYFSEYWGRVPFYVSAWEFRPSTYETFAIAYHSQSLWNETGWSSPDLDALLDAAHGELNEAKRKELYKKAQQFIMAEGAVMIPYFQSVLTALRTRVEGFQPHPAGWVDLRDVQVQG